MDEVEAARRIAELEAALARAERQAGLDPLTGLANRRWFSRALEMAESRAVRDGTDVAVVCLDIDGLKVINDRDGHDAGDGILLLTADVLHRFSRDHDLAARLGGDEFAIIIHAGAPGVQAAVSRLSTHLAEVGVSATIGWAPRSADGGLSAADAQIRAIKHSGEETGAALRTVTATRVAQQVRLEHAQALGMVMLQHGCDASCAEQLLAEQAHAAGRSTYEEVRRLLREAGG